MKIKLLFIALLMIDGAAYAFGEPWYMVYKNKEDSKLTLTKGPYHSEAACLDAKNFLHWPQVFIECTQ